jgi:TRAP-type C4-dicarboxylate transport system substrate-binding protein
MSSEGFTNAIGGVLIARSRWEVIPAELQDVVKTIVKKYARQVVVRTRQENQEALRVLHRQGIQMVDLHPEERNRLLHVSREVWEGQAGKLYPRTLLEEVQSLLKAYRERKP